MSIVRKDLLLVVPDKNTEFTLRGALPQHKAFGIRPVTFDIKVHPGRDGGVRTGGADLVRLLRAQFSHLIIIFDHEGCGAELQSVDSLQAELEGKLQPFWGDQAAVIVIAPEVDIWMWGSDNLLSELLEWDARHSIRDWLREKNFAIQDTGKPVRPKESLDAILAAKKMPRSSSVYQRIASRQSLSKCSDGAFQRLRTLLQLWFPPDKIE